VLHEHLYTLPCRRAPDYGGLSLRNELVAAGVLRELDTRNEHAALAGLIHRSLIEFQNAQPSSADRSPTGLGNYDRARAAFVAQFLEIPLGDGVAQDLGDKEAEHSGTLHDSRETMSQYSATVSDPSTFEQLVGRLIASVDQMGSGNYDDDKEDRGALLREMYYIVASECYSIPYWPQFTRLRFAKLFPNYFDRSFRTKLFRKVAEAMKCSVTEAFDDLREQVAFVPPFSSVVFERSSRPEDIPHSLLEVRDEYRGLRQNLIELESARQTATSIKERRRLRERQRLILENSAKSFDRPKTVTLEGVIRYLPEIAKPVAAPLNPTSYGAELLLKPVQWISEWWRRRPVAPVFDLAAHVESIADYSKLINKVFGNRFYYAEPWERVFAQT